MTSAAQDALSAWMADTRRSVDAALEREFPTQARDDSIPAQLAEAMRYALMGGGKRFRPAIVRMIATHFGARDDEAVLPAVAIELVHTYSLVHDDLPCMDDDDLRRGRPTCHKVFGEALAVLAGDALLTHAFTLLARAPSNASEMVAALARGAGPAGMVGGQVLDLAAVAGVPTHVRVDEIHAKKTAALIAVAAELGALSADVRDERRHAAHAWGLALGRCFQATDDILDVTGDAATLGKTPGKDARNERPTLVAALGIDGARREAERLAAEVERAAALLGCRPGDRPHDLARHLLARRA